MNNFLRKTLKLGKVALHSLTFQLKCSDFQSNRYKKLVPVLLRLCNWLLKDITNKHFTKPNKFSNNTTKKSGSERKVRNYQASLKGSNTATICIPSRNDKEVSGIKIVTELFLRSL